jgi:phage tail sheath gpL-like
MAIITTVPASKRRPGVYVQHKEEPAGQSLIPIPTRVVCVGIKATGGTATAETPVQVFDAADSDAKAGKGSELALMARAMLDQSALEDGKPEIYLCPIAPPSGVATQNTITVTGTATASGTLVLRIAGRTINVGVSVGDLQGTVAAAIEKVLDSMAAVLPFTAGVATNVVTCTNTHTGTTGNGILFAVESGIAGVSIAFSQSVAGTGTADITNALDALYDKKYNGIAIANHLAADVTDALAHLATAWGFSQQSPRFIVIGENGSVATAQALATAANHKAIIVVNAEGSGSLPGELAALACSAWFSHERPNINMNNAKLAGYAPIASLVFTDAEIESHLNTGVTPLVATADGRLAIVKLVTTYTTDGAAPSEAYRGAARPRTQAFMGEQLAAAYSAQFSQEYATEETAKRVRDMIIGVHRAAETAEYIRNVDDLVDEILVELAASPAGRFNAAAPFIVADPLDQTVIVNNMRF